MAGRIEFLELRDGDRFEDGQVLVRFDCEAVGYNAAIARALRNKAAKVYENKRRLGQLGSIAALDIDVAAADLAQASAEVDLAVERLSRCEIKAPFPGISAEVAVKRYQYVNEGEPLMQVLDDRELEVEMLVPSLWLLHLDVGDRFQVLLDETATTYEATLVRFSGRIDAVSQTVKAYGKIEGQRPELMAGMSGRATFPQIP
jgi:RND family efflux transporter MFP subunit